MPVVQLRYRVKRRMRNVRAACEPCSPSVQFQETWKMRQLIAKPGVCLNTTQTLHNVYYLSFSILLEHWPLGMTGCKSVAPHVHKGGNVPTSCCRPRWRLWPAECWFAVQWWFLVCSLTVICEPVDLEPASEEQGLRKAKLVSAGAIILWWALLLLGKH